MRESVANGIKTSVFRMLISLLTRSLIGIPDTIVAVATMTEAAINDVCKTASFDNIGILFGEIRRFKIYGTLIYYSKEKGDADKMDIIYAAYVGISLVFGIIILLAMRYGLDFPFPWQIRTHTKRASEPDSTALSECFAKLSDNEQLHLVMGNVSYFVCEQDTVINSLSKALEKNIRIRLIHGPEVDPRSEKFLSIIMKNPKVEVFSYPKNPTLHFRVLIDSEGKPRKVYVEEPHLPYEDKGYRCISSGRVSRQYEDLFLKMLSSSKGVKASA
jgi:hypothetical protein